MTILLGRWQDVLADVECDALICDPPYSDRTHRGARADRNDGAEDDAAPTYEPWTDADVREFFGHWSDRVRGWIVVLTDSVTQQLVRDEAERAGRCAFAPVPCVLRGMTVRQQGDGPSSWALYAMMSRPRRREFMGGWTRPGAYVGAAGDESAQGRGKPAWLMRALVADYSSRDQLIADPFAGWGATEEAAIGYSRRSVGAERDSAAHAEAVRRTSRFVQRELFA